jgi:uncharacterized protein YndB with AHSA1/START domain
MSGEKTLQVNPNGDREIVMSRVFDAPREMVFEAWTKPELLKRWLLGPPGWEMVVCEVDYSPGGTTRFVWRKATGEEMGMRMIGVEFVPPERIVCIEKFDEPWYPGEARTTLTFTERDGKTTATTTVRYDSQATRDMVLKSGMTTGVAASYDRLEEILTGSLKK